MSNKNIIIRTSDFILVILVVSLFLAAKTGYYLVPVFVGLALIIQIIKERNEEL